MKPHASKLQHTQKEESLETQQSAATTGKEFQSAEEMLRTDAAQTPVPESVRTRLSESVQKAPPGGKPRSWWKRLFC